MTKPNSAPPIVNAWSRVNKYAVCGLVLSILFFSAFVRDAPLREQAIANLRDELVNFFEPSFQYAMSGIVCGYLFVLMLLNLRRLPPRRLSLTNSGELQERDAVWISNLLLLGILIWVLATYILQYRQAASRTDALVLLCCLLLNQGLIWMLAERGEDVAMQVRRSFVTLFIVIGCFCLFLSPLNSNPNVIRGGQFMYHSQARWTGIWQNPNIFGLLMAVVFVLSAGRLWRRLQKRDEGHWLPYLLPSVIAIICVMKSYSRGAWVGTLCGAAFLFWHDWAGNAWTNNDLPPQNNDRKKKLFLFGIAGLVLGFLLVLAFKTAEQKQIPIVQRMVSAFGQRDFSSQNRLASYQDGINMLTDRPFAGFGWENVIRVHTALYLQSGLSTGEAIKLNDFLMLALRLGLPMFSVFLLFLWVWFSAGRRQNPMPKKFDQDIRLCRSATLMLAVGFLFMDGLFRLACGGAFWLFLTLSLDFGAIAPRAITDEDHRTDKINFASSS